MGWRSVQESVERTALGRIVISILLVVIVITLVTANLPDSRLQRLLLSADHPVLYSVGLDQSWGVFAPDPRRQVVQFRADVTYADGGHASWRVPTGDAFVGEYWDYRWLKWVEYALSADYGLQLWQPAAIYAARKSVVGTHRPMYVKLVSRWYNLQPPGHVRGPHRWHEHTYFTLLISDEMLRGSSS
jgi:hypothetical protein